MMDPRYEPCTGCGGTHRFYPPPVFMPKKTPTLDSVHEIKLDLPPVITKLTVLQKFGFATFIDEEVVGEFRAKLRAVEKEIDLLKKSVDDFGGDGFVTMIEESFKRFSRIGKMKEECSNHAHEYVRSRVSPKLWPSMRDHIHFIVNSETGGIRVWIESRVAQSLGLQAR